MFTFSEKHITDYHRTGCTIFREILPPSLVTDLRRVADRARELARDEKGEQTQRHQPVGAYDLDLQPLRDYGELDVLNDAIQRVLTPRTSGTTCPTGDGRRSTTSAGLPNTRPTSTKAGIDSKGLSPSTKPRNRNPSFQFSILRRPFEFGLTSTISPIQEVIDVIQDKYADKFQTLESTRKFP